jgi:hypothetical protein
LVRGDPDRLENSPEVEPPISAGLPNRVVHGVRIEAVAAEHDRQIGLRGLLHGRRDGLAGRLRMAEADSQYSHGLSLRVVVEWW